MTLKLSNLFSVVLILILAFTWYIPTINVKAISEDDYNQLDESELVIAGLAGTDVMTSLFNDFNLRTGITVNYSENWSVEDFVNCETNGNCPDVGLLSQPGLMENLVNSDQLYSLEPFINNTTLNTNYSDTWINLGKVNNTLYGVFYNATNKSLIFYDPLEFSNQSWTIPSTWTELLTLTDKILLDTGKSPWSIGNESGVASGWPLTDWFEDILLRSAGPQIYDDLVNHEVSWIDPAVLGAAAYFGDIFGNEEYQLGGKFGTINTNFLDAIWPLYWDTPEAYLHKQGSWASASIQNAFPSQIAGVDFGLFPFPEIDLLYIDAVMGGGDFAVVFNETDQAKAFINYLITVDAAEVWIQNGNMSPNKNLDLNLYVDPNIKVAATELVNANIFKFDLSDQLPSDLNLKMWEEMDDLVMAAPDPEAMRNVLARIEIWASGPKFIYLPVVVH